MVCAVLAWGDSMPLDLGGLRKVNAIVKRNQEGFECEVSFLAVNCFSPGTNRRINLSKSREYVIQSLAKAEGVTRGTIKISKLTVARPLEVKGRLASITYQAENVEATAASRPAKSLAGSETVGVNVNKEKTLLSCLEDMRSTLESLDTLLREDIAALKLGADVESDVADLEQRGIDDYKRLQDESAAEKLLLSTEKASLSSEIEQKRRAFLDRLSSAFADLESKHARETKQ